MASGDINMGGKISLVGFSELDGASLDIVRKVVGAFAERVSRQDRMFEGLKVTLKELHKRDKGEIYEVHAHLFEQGHKFNSISTERNLFVALDDALKNVAKEAEHAMGKMMRK